MADVQPLSFTPPDVDPATFGFAFCEGGVCAAQGVKASGTHAGFRADPNRLDLAVVAADEACTCAATFTQNRFCAAPVQVSRPRAAAGVARAVMLNSGNANASTGEQGLAIAKQSAKLLADALGCPEEQILVASTGVIGQQQAIDPYLDGAPAAVACVRSPGHCAGQHAQRGRQEQGRNHFFPVLTHIHSSIWHKTFFNGMLNIIAVMNYIFKSELALCMIAFCFSHKIFVKNT